VSDRLKTVTEILATARQSGVETQATLRRTAAERRRIDYEEGVAITDQSFVLECLGDQLVDALRDSDLTLFEQLDRLLQLRETDPMVAKHNPFDRRKVLARFSLLVAGQPVINLGMNNVTGIVKETPKDFALNKCEVRRDRGGRPNESNTRYTPTAEFKVPVTTMSLITPPQRYELNAFMSQDDLGSALIGRDAIEQYIGRVKLLTELNQGDPETTTVEYHTLEDLKSCVALLHALGVPEINTWNIDSQLAYAHRRRVESGQHMPMPKIYMGTDSVERII